MTNRKCEKCGCEISENERECIKCENAYPIQFKQAINFGLLFILVILLKESFYSGNFSVVSGILITIIIDLKIMLWPNLKKRYLFLIIFLIVIIGVLLDSLK